MGTVERGRGFLVGGGARAALEAGRFRSNAWQARSSIMAAAAAKAMGGYSTGCNNRWGVNCARARAGLGWPGRRGGSRGDGEGDRETGIQGGRQGDKEGDKEGDRGTRRETGRETQEAQARSHALLAREEN